MYDAVLVELKNATVCFDHSTQLIEMYYPKEKSTRLRETQGSSRWPCDQIHGKECRFPCNFGRRRVESKVPSRSVNKETFIGVVLEQRVRGWVI